MERDDVAYSEKTRADVRRDPVRAVLSCPAVDEETGGREEGREGEEGDAELGASDAVVAGFEMPVDAVVEGGADLGAEPEAQAQGDVVEAADAGGLVVVGRVGPEGWEGREHEVHDAVDVGHVDGEGLDDGLGGEEAEGADERGPKDLGEGLVLALGFGLVGGVVGVFTEGVSADAEDLGSVGFAEEEETGDLDDAVGDGGGVEDPAPGGVFGDEAAGDRADGWA